MPRHSIVLAAIFMVLFSIAAPAQSRMGLEAGPNFSRILNVLQGFNASGQEVIANSQSITRFAGGVFVDIFLDSQQHFSLRPGIRYLGAGGQTPLITDFNGNVLMEATKYTFNYAQVPFQLLYSPNFPFGKPWIGGGLYPSLLFSAKEKTNAGTADMQIGSAGFDQVKRLDLGYIASLGVTFKCGVLIGAEYQQSLARINPYPTGGSAPKVHNSIWGIRLGYEFSK